MTDHVTVTDEGAIRIVRMNRPEKKNALTAAMYDAMAAALESVTDAPDIRCVLITGVPGTFTAGNDMQDFLKAATGGAGLGNEVVRFLHALPRCARPLVAAVEGNAVGLGVTMMFHCDYVVAAHDTRFLAPFVSLGILPEAASTLLAPMLMGYARAFELLVMGAPMSGDEAKVCGLVNAVAPAGQVEAAALAAARRIAALPPQAVAISRSLMRDPEPIVARMNKEGAHFRERFKSPEARAAFEAFLQRKK